MRPSQRLAIRANELQEEIAAFAEIPEQLTDEQQANLKELRSENKDVRLKLSAALETEVAPIETRHAEGSEGKELRELIERANLGVIFDAAVERRSTEGPELELQKHYGLGENQIPIALLETRATGVTPAPANVGQTQAAVVPAVFPMSCASFMNVDLPTVPTGEAVFPVLSTSADAGTPAENASQAETAGGFTADVLSPGRIQASFFYSREDRARFSGMAEALRMNLSDALSDKLDQQILNGSNGLFNGTNLANHAVTGITSYTNYRDLLAYGRVDGKFAGSVADLKVLMGASTYAHAAKAFRSDNAGDRAALEDLMQVTGGVKVSAHVPPVASTKQNAVIRLGARRDMVAPIWEGIQLIPDEITKAASGQVVITAIMLYAIKIIRAAGFYKQETKHS